MSLLSRFYGNNKVNEALVFYQRDGRFPHGILLEGDPGLGKKTFAKRIAASAVCTGQGEKPCGVCSHCKKIEKGIHPDVITIAPEAGKRSFKKEQVESLRADAFIRPNEAARKVYMLCEAQFMTPQAQNALLKILEEPPAGVMFILTCDNRFKLLETIRSRVVTLALEPVSAEDTVAALMEQDPSLTADKAEEAAVGCGGNIGQALRLLADEKYAALMEKADTVCRMMENSDRFGLLKELSALEGDREGLIACLEQVRQLLAQNTKDSFGEKNLRRYRILPLQAAKVLAIIEQGVEYARQNMSMPLLTTWLGAGIGSAFEE